MVGSSGQGVRKKKVSYTMPFFMIKDFLTLPPPHITK